jgi:hypothetical protein
MTPQCSSPWSSLQPLPPLPRVAPRAGAPRPRHSSSTASHSVCPAPTLRSSTTQRCWCGAAHGHAVAHGHASPPSVTYLMHLWDLCHTSRSTGMLYQCASQAVPSGSPPPPTTQPGSLSHRLCSLPWTWYRAASCHRVKPAPLPVPPHACTACCAHAATPQAPSPPPACKAVEDPNPLSVPAQGAAWKSSSNLLMQLTDTFAVASFSTGHVLLQQYSGWGVSATWLRVEPDSPVRLHACAILHACLRASLLAICSSSSSSYSALRCSWIVRSFACLSASSNARVAL